MTASKGGRYIHWHCNNIHIKFVYLKMSFGKMTYGKMSFGKMTFGQMFLHLNCFPVILMSWWFFC